MHLKILYQQQSQRLNQLEKVTVEPTVELEAESVQPKRRGRPRKIQTEEPVTNVVKRGRGDLRNK